MMNLPEQKNGGKADSGCDAAHSCLCFEAQQLCPLKLKLTAEI